MKHSQRIQNMLAPFSYDDISKFLRIFEIFYQVEPYGYIPTNSHMGFRHNGKSYEYRDEDTFHFYTPKASPYGPYCIIITFKNNEDQVVNKFERFIKMKAFL